ncbi:MAG: SIMPL domain-containing protein [Acidimicrobiales bacterium]
MVGAAAAGLTLAACGGGPAPAAGSSPTTTAAGHTVALAAKSSAPGAKSTVPAGCSGPTVTAEGSGTASAAPDLLTLTLGVHTQASTAQAALAANNTKAQALVSTLEKAGVAKADLQTTGLSINPTYSKPKGGPPMVNGYQVDDTVTAKIHKLSSAGTLIDAAAAKVGNAVRLEGVSFSLQHDSAVQAQAHTQAVQAAVGQARAMAKAAKGTLGALCSVSDVPAQITPYPFRTAGAGAAGSASVAAPPTVPVQAGTEQVSARVTVVYALTS